MPRTSASAAAYPIAPGKRLQPPDDFPPGSPERKFFLETVASVPPDHFHPSDLPDLVVFCGAYIDWLTARGELKLERNIIDGKVNPLIAVVKDYARTVAIYSRLLRLNPVARTPLLQKQEPQNLSYYQKQALGEASDDEQAH